MVKRGEGNIGKKGNGRNEPSNICSCFGQVLKSDQLKNIYVCIPVCMYLCIYFFVHNNNKRNK